jgi:diphosphomevalonate decarboxylase
MCFKKIIHGTYKPKKYLYKFFISCYNKRFYPKAFSLTWQSSNGVLPAISFGGERDNQIPNPSVSFTLNCKTVTKLAFIKEKQDTFRLIYFFEGKPKEISNRKSKFLERIEYTFKDYHFTIDTNTFPHSSGIASSASGMAALATEH